MELLLGGLLLDQIISEKAIFYRSSIHSGLIDQMNGNINKIVPSFPFGNIFLLQMARVMNADKLIDVQHWWKGQLVSEIYVYIKERE